jgi:hypothetical protein
VGGFLTKQILNPRLLGWGKRNNMAVQYQNIQLTEPAHADASNGNKTLDSNVNKKYSSELTSLLLAQL